MLTAGVGFVGAVFTGAALARCPRHQGCLVRLRLLVAVAAGGAPA